MSELALQLISENKKSRETFLDLGNCGLKEVPAELGELVWLESVSFASRRDEWDGRKWNVHWSQNTGDENSDLVSIAPLAGLSRLRSVVISRTQVSDLSPVAGLMHLQTLNVSNTPIVDLSPLANLTALRSLDVSYSAVADLSPLAGLTALQLLNFSSTDVTDLSPLAQLTTLQVLTGWTTQVADVSPLAKLTALQTLDVRNTRVEYLSPLASLAALQRFNVSYTRVANLSPLANLTALQSLNVSKSHVADLSPLANLTALQSLDVSDTDVTDLSPLTKLTSLQKLNVSDTPVADLSPLVNLTALQALECYNTRVADLLPLTNLTELRSLHVAHTKVANLSGLSSLTALEWLNASNIPASNLAPLAQLTSLKSLYVGQTPTADLSPLTKLDALQKLELSETQVANLSPLASLPALRELSVSKTAVVDLSPVASLTALRTLNLSNTAVSDLSPLASLARLQTLYASDTKVTDLSPLAQLTSLKSLYVGRTPTADLSPLIKLDALQRLDITYTQVTDLTSLKPLISRGCALQVNSDTWRYGILVEGCPLMSPPIEIVAQGNEAVLNYFRERELGDVDHLYEAKMLLVGEGGAGKTSLLRRLYQPNLPLPSEHETTKGVFIYSHEFPLKNGRYFRLNVWDFGGQEIYHATHQFFLTRRSLYLLLDDTRRDHKSVSDHGFKYWLDLVDLFGGHSPVLIFQNEKGGRSKAIDIAGIKGQYDNVKDVYAGNLEQRTAADQLRDAIEYHASHLEHIGEELPAHWIKVRADLERRAGEVPYITQHEYFHIYSRHMNFERTKALHLSRYLHDLGVFLHYQDEPLLSRSVILQNEWATDAVFRILDDHTIKVHLGRFTLADCERLWRDSVYADMHPELLALMQRFELCYPLFDSKPQTWLAPQLLPPAKPTALTDWGKPEDLVLRYRYHFMPKGVISRLTVRLHRFVCTPEMAWITGVLFERHSTIVLVEVLASGGEIELRGRGPERQALLSVVAADLDALNESFQGLRDKVNKRIPCNCKQCRVAPAPEFFAEKYLRRRKEDNRLKLECPSSYEEVDVLELLDGIRTEQLPGWAKNQTPATNLRTIRIFLASSAELRDDRDAFDLYFRQQNDQFVKEGLYLTIDRWENFLDAISETRLQDEYNKKVRACDIFVSLFFTKTGKFTEEEFDIAHRQFKTTGRPRIYTFFKNADVRTGDIGEDLLSLLQFKKKLANLGHFYTSYDNIEHLKRHFRDQLDKPPETTD